VLSMFFTSTELALQAHGISLLRGLILIVPLAVLFARLGGMTGVWLAFPVTEALTAGLGWVFGRNRYAHSG
jgi:Na+-driven multidrug efflux pump